MIIWNFGSPEETARALSDNDLKKQIKAIAQALCDAYYIFLSERPRDSEINLKNYISRIPLGAKHMACPYATWASKCLANYEELVKMGLACCEEYEYRFFIGKLILNKNEIRKSGFYNDYNHIIEFARDNVPELRGCREENKSACTPDCSPRYCFWDNHTTPFPLLIPHKYKHLIDCPAWGHYISAGEGEVEYVPGGKVTFDLIESYRNYYRYKLNRVIECKECEGTGNGIDCFCCDYGSCNDGKAPCCNGKGYKEFKHKWTRRDKPSWVKL